jgi:MmyB-like transcription regulator ligand binding domain
VGWLDGTGDRNLLRFIFLEPSARSLIHDYVKRARRVVAEFRADVSAHLNDPAILRLVEDLNERSEAFKRHWRERVVLGREGGERTFDHSVTSARQSEVSDAARLQVAEAPQSLLCRAVFSPPHREESVVRASTAPVWLFLRNSSPDLPESCFAATTLPSGIVTFVPAVT